MGQGQAKSHQVISDDIKHLRDGNKGQQVNQGGANCQRGGAKRKKQRAEGRQVSRRVYQSFCESLGRALTGGETP